MKWQFSKGYPVLFIAAFTPSRDSGCQGNEFDNGSSKMLLAELWVYVNLCGRRHALKGVKQIEFAIARIQIE